MAVTRFTLVQALSFGLSLSVCATPIPSVRASDMLDAPVSRSSPDSVRADAGPIAHPMSTIPLDDGSLVVGYDYDASSKKATGAVARLTSAGDLDPSFGTGGIVLFDPGSQSLPLYDGSVADDGSITVVGQMGSSLSPEDGTVFLARLSADGTPDTDFGDNGWAVTGMTGAGYTVVATPRGPVFSHAAFSPYRQTLSRLTDSGQIDTTFGTGGTATISGGSVDDIALLEQGRLAVSRVATHDGRAVVDVFSASGRPVSSFGRSGSAAYEMAFGRMGVCTTAVRSRPGGGVTLAAALNRIGGVNSRATILTIALRSDGSLDTTVGKAGWTRTDLTTVRDGRCPIDDLAAVAGRATWESATTRQKTIDLALRASGKLVVLLDDDRIAPSTFVVQKRHPSGSLDTSFGTTGRVRFPSARGLTQSHAAAIQGDEILVAYSELGAPRRAARIIRYTRTGLVDTGFGSDGRVTLGPSLIPTSITVDADNRIVVLSRSTESDQDVAIRLLPDGSRDASFGTAGAQTLGTHRTTRLIPHGRGYLVQSTFNVSRILENGATDQAFSSTIRSFAPIAVDAIGPADPTGRIAVVTDARVVLLDGTGKRLRTMAASTPVARTSTEKRVEVAADGRVVVHSATPKPGSVVVHTEEYRPGGRRIDVATDTIPATGTVLRIVDIERTRTPDKAPVYIAASSRTSSMIVATPPR